MLTEKLLDVDPDSLVIKRASCLGTLQGLMDSMSEIRKADKKCIIQVFDPEAIVSREHIIASYINALASFSEKANRAGNASVEMLLFAAMTRQISAAIKLVGAKSEDGFVLFTDSKRAYAKLRRYLKGVSEFKPTERESLRAARNLRIKAKSASSATRTLLQEMALSGLEQ